MLIDNQCATREIGRSIKPDGHLLNSQCKGPAKFIHQNAISTNLNDDQQITTLICHAAYFIRATFVCLFMASTLR